MNDDLYIQIAYEQRGRSYKMMIGFNIEGVAAVGGRKIFPTLGRICAHLCNLRMPFSNPWKAIVV